MSRANPKSETRNPKWMLVGLMLMAFVGAASAVIIKPNGSTDVSVYFFVCDPNGDPNTDIAEADLDIYYVKQGAAISAKVDMTALAAADSAHADNKGFDCGQGILRVDFPDAAFDGGIGTTVERIVRDVTPATDDKHKDIIVPITVQLGVAADLRYLAGAATAVTNLDKVYNSEFDSVFDDTNDVLNARTVHMSRGAGVMESTDVETSMATAIKTAIGVGAADDSLGKMVQDVDEICNAMTLVTAKLDTMLTLDGAVYKLTTNALEEGPSADVTLSDIWSATWTSDSSFNDPTKIGGLLMGAASKR